MTLAELKAKYIGYDRVALLLEISELAAERERSKRLQEALEYILKETQNLVEGTRAIQVQKRIIGDTAKQALLESEQGEGDE